MKTSEEKMEQNRITMNKNLARMLKGGVIMDVTNAREAAMAVLEKAAGCTPLKVVAALLSLIGATGTSR